MLCINCNKNEKAYGRKICNSCQWKLRDTSHIIKKRKSVRRRLKEKCIDYKGGKCEKCGYNKCPSALEFHHPTSDKKFGISHKLTFNSFELIKEELDKCALLCANCHRELHYET